MTLVSYLILYFEGQFSFIDDNITYDGNGDQVTYQNPFRHRRDSTWVRGVDVLPVVFRSRFRDEQPTSLLCLLCVSDTFDIVRTVRTLRPVTPRVRVSV